MGEQARELLENANELLDRFLKEKCIRAKGVIALFAANTIGDDDVEIYTDDSRSDIRAVLHTIRQQSRKPPRRPNMALADFVAPKSSGVADYIGMFAVTTGLGCDELAAEFEKDHDDYNSIMVKALCDRLAEAFAERLHERVRKEFWGYASDEKLDNAAIIAEEYCGIRPAPGYPACPDHTEKGMLFDLTNARENADMELTESFAMMPGASVCGIYFAHPEAKYFGTGRIERDQVEDYARRKGMDIRFMERWLSPILGYDPGEKRKITAK